MMTRVKICGCMRVEDALAAKGAGADFVGVMFAPSSRRRVTIAQAREIVEAMSGANSIEVPAPDGDWQRRAEQLGRAIDRAGRPLVVGVFEDQQMDEVNAIAKAVGLDLIQLSGRESWEDCARAVRPVVKTIEPPIEADAVPPGDAMALLLDVSQGRGIAADRAAASEIAHRLPIWLAGGLTPENVRSAIREVRPWAVDVSSGVETDERKDRAKIRAFVQAVRTAAIAAIERSS
jgi:phosphoribosylanthranilate isomerase